MYPPMPPFTQEHAALSRTIVDVVERELAPHATAWERDRAFPDAVFPALAAHDLLGIKYPAEYGGRGAGWLEEAVFVEALAHCGSGGLAAGIGAHCEIATAPIHAFGTASQRRRWLPAAIRGETIAALAITEPGAGSDVAALRTRAVAVDGGWLVNGAKQFITNGVRAGLLVTAVRTGGPGHGGISFLLIERGPGVRSEPIDKLGWHASDTALIAFDDVFVPAENLLGELDRGFALIMSNFAWERLTMALGSVAAMQVAFDRTVRFARTRQTFGRPIAKHQVIAHRLADLETTIHALRCLTYDALRRFVEGEDATRAVAMAKLATQRGAVDVIDACLQIHGGAGYLAETGIERMLRDARLGPIGGGTDEIMREILARSLA